MGDRLLKICGVTRLQDLQVCAQTSGVSHVGINLWSGSRRGLTLDQAHLLLEQWPPAQRQSVQTVGVFVDHDPAFVEAAVQRLSLDAAQLHGDRPFDDYAALAVPLIWVIRGTPELSQLQWPKRAPAWVLLDALVTGFGGMGTTTDWSWARSFVERLGHRSPVWLAGGLSIDNAAQAVRVVEPAGLDVASGAEAAGASRGEKDPDKIRALAAVLRSS